MDERRFVIEVYDPETECIASDIGFEVEDVQELLALLDIEGFEMYHWYDLEADHLTALNRRYGLSLDITAPLVRFRSHCDRDDRPYKLHTCRELAMMLAGTKPLAAFLGPHRPGEEVVEIPERVFAPHIASRRFVMRELIEPPPSVGHPPLRHVLYALPHEAWRIDAYLLLWRTAEKSGWNEGFERMEGSLLGYEDWQNDWHIARMWELRAAAVDGEQAAGEQPEKPPEG
jgi:hypothetical protein